MIRLGILGYGNLGRGVENAIKLNDDMELCAIFTRRNPQDVKVNSNTPVVSVSDIEQWKDKIDVLIICFKSPGYGILSTLFNILLNSLKSCFKL